MQLPRSLSDLMLCQTVRRKSLQDFFWPHAENNLFREQSIKDGNWYNGWFCRFEDQGLSLKITYFFTYNQFELWRQNQPLRTNVETGLPQPYNENSISLGTIGWSSQYCTSKMEEVRRYMYISKHFGASAWQMQAAQFLKPNDPTTAIYLIGFDRAVTQNDQNVLTYLKASAPADLFKEIFVDIGSTHSIIRATRSNSNF